MLSLNKITKTQYKAALIIWTIITITLLLMPASSFSHTTKLINIPYSDKIAHFVLFGILSFLIFKNISFLYKKLRLNKNIAVITIIFLFGLLTETLQGLMYNTAKRTFSLSDLAFDTLSAIVVTIILFLYKKKKQKKTQQYYKIKL